MNRVVLTGATSYLGKYLISELIKKNYFVYAVVKKNSEKKLDIKNANHSIIECSLENMNNLSSLIAKDCFAFFHFAWNGTRGETRNDEILQKSNYEYSLNAVETAKKLKCRYFIGAGSQAEYGINFDYLDENTIANPNTAYGKYKLKFAVKCNALCKKYNINFLIPRFFSLYGPNDFEETIIQSTVKKMLANEPCLLTDCMQNWNFMHFSDAAQALIYLMENNFSGVYNFASPDTRKLKDFLENIRSLINSKSVLQFGAIPQSEKKVSLNPNIDKLIKTGFKHKISFEQGIKEIIKAEIEKQKVINEENKYSCADI